MRTALFDAFPCVKSAAVEAQRIGAMPLDELRKAFAEASGEKRLLYFNELINYLGARRWVCRLRGCDGNC